MSEYPIITGEDMRDRLIDYTKNVDAFSRFEIFKQNFLLRLFSEWEFTSPEIQEKTETIAYTAYAPGGLSAAYENLRHRISNRNSYLRKTGREPEYALPDSPKRVREGSLRRLAKILNIDPSEVLAHIPKVQKTKIKKIAVQKNSPQIIRILDNYNTLTNNIYTFIVSSSENFERSQKSGNKSTACFQRILAIISGRAEYMSAVSDGYSIKFGNVEISLKDLGEGEGA